jgi:hypothetical protein
MLLFKGTNISVEWDEENEIIKYTLYGFGQGESLREEVNNFVAAVEQKKAKRVLVDATEMKVVSNTDQDWATGELLVRLKGVGTLYFAIIIPKSALTQLAFQRMSKKMEELEIHNFADKEDAINWLKTR